MTSSGEPETAGSIPFAGQQLARPITLIGGIAIVVGGVIGMGIFALISQLAIFAGTSLWLAFLVATIISVVGVVPLVQIASALPRAGGGYFYGSRLLNPIAGCLASSWAILGGASSTCVVSLGLAGYISERLPDGLSVKVIAVALVMGFFLLYQFGLQLAMWLQVLMVVQLFLALAVYATAGAAHIHVSYSLEFPRGFQGFSMAVIICYSVCMGFQVIAEVGEEMVHAKRNIPLSLAIGGAVVVVLYVLVGNTFVSSIPYNVQRLEAMRAPLAESGSLFLSPFWVIFLHVGALSAGLTSLNAAAIALPREILAQARDKVLPSVLASVNGRTRTPLNAEMTYFVGVIVLILAGGSLDFYGVMAAVGILLMTIVLSVAAVRLPRKYPRRYRNAYIRIPVPLLDVLAVISIITSGAFVAMVVAQASVVVLIYAVFTGVVVAHFVFRTRSLARNGFRWADQMALAPGFDEAE